MKLNAHTVVANGMASYEVGLQMGREISAGVERLSLVIAHATVNHDQHSLLRGVHDALPPGVPILGCSTQGIMTRGSVVEEGYVAGGIGLGGDAMAISTGHADEIQQGTAAKGAALGRSLKQGLAHPPKVVLLYYDPLCGADMDQLLAALFDEVRCPIVGGGAGQIHGPMIRTHQYFGQRVFSHGAVAVALGGEVGIGLAICQGTSPVGIEMTVTKAEGTLLLELDGRPALDVWQELTSAGPPSVAHTAALSIAIPSEPGSDHCAVRAAFGVDSERRGVLLQVAVPVGTVVMLHHRTVKDVLEGAIGLGRGLLEQLGGRTPRVVLGFECGARTKPFLGTEATLRENLGLQQALGPDAAWLGMLAWGELCPVGARPAFHNYAYPLLVLTD